MAKQPKIIFSEGSNKEWFWTTVASNGKKIARSSEGLSSLQKAVRCYNAQTKIHYQLHQIEIPKKVVDSGYDFVRWIDPKKIVIKKYKAESLHS